MHKEKERSRLVEQAHRYLEAAGRPRLVMLGVLAVTLAAGFLASVAMVHLGVNRMPIRYPLAVGVSYATFLGLLWGWLQRQSIATTLSDDPEGLLIPGAAAFGAAALGEKLLEEEKRKPKSTSHYHGGGNIDIGGIGDSLGALVILVLIAGVCTLIVSVYLVATSPVLLAELLVDGVLLGAMSRAISPDGPPHWSRAVIRRTWLAALMTAIVFGLVGFGIERVVPGAHTLGEAWAVDRARR
jgi:hypothetical protein